MSPSVVLSNVEDGGLRDTALGCADGASTRPYQLLSWTTRGTTPVGLVTQVPSALLRQLQFCTWTLHTNNLALGWF